MYISAMGLLIITSFIGAAVNGAKRWIVVGPFSISSASFGSVLFIVSFIGFLEKYKGEKARWAHNPKVIGSNPIPATNPSHLS